MPGIIVIQPRLSVMRTSIGKPWNRYILYPQANIRALWLFLLFVGPTLLALVASLVAPVLLRRW